MSGFPKFTPPKFLASAIHASRRRAAVQPEERAEPVLPPRVLPSPPVTQKAVSVSAAQPKSGPPRTRADSLEEPPPPPPYEETDAQALERLLAMELANERLQREQAALLASPGGRELHDKWNQLSEDVAWLSEHFQSRNQPAAQLLAACARELSAQAGRPEALKRITNEAIRACSKVRYHCRSPGIDCATVAEKLVAMHARAHLDRPAEFNSDMAGAIQEATLRYHEAATGQTEICSMWNWEDPPVASGKPDRPAAQIDLIGCVRAARFLNLYTEFGGRPSGSRITYAQNWGTQYKSEIPLTIRVEDLTRAEIDRLCEPGVKPEWDWLPGLHEAAHAAVAAAVRPPVRIHLLPEVAELSVHYVVDGMGL